MTPPVLSPQQRADALARAREVRTARVALLERVASGEIGLAALLERADSDPVVGRTRLDTALRALPGVGAVTAKRLAERAGADPGRRLHVMTPRQRAALLTALPGQPQS